MSFGKEIIVLSGGRHKGVVKLQNAIGKSGTLKGTCSLDYIPRAAVLYIVGDSVAETPLNNYETVFEIPDSSQNGLSCLILSNEPPMFGSTTNNAAKAAVSAKVDRYLSDKKSSRTEEKRSIPDSGKYEPRLDDGEKREEQNPECGCKADDNEQESYKEESAQPRNSEDMIRQEESGKADDQNADKNGERGRRAEARSYAASDSAADKPLGEWVKYDGNNFYLAVKPQLDEMFECYPDEKNLNAAVPNSRWVKVDADDGYYVVGLLYDGSAPSFICYGVPSRGSVRPPEELEGMCVWLPLEQAAGGDGDGYWVIYQSALNGEIIK